LFVELVARSEGGTCLRIFVHADGYITVFAGVDGVIVGKLGLEGLFLRILDARDTVE
jgi:hypothetical protein